jgi:molybdate transport system ATP-binding protein
MISIKATKKLLSSAGELLLEIDTEIEPGSVVALYGESGAGKTTLLKIIAGLLKPETALIKNNDQTWNDSSNKIFTDPKDRNTGFVFQDYALFPNMTVRENILFGIKKDKAPGSNKSKNEKVLILMEEMDLHELADMNVRFLSGGQKQRVAIARSLAYSPGLLLLDEPLAALNEELQSRIRKFIYEYHKQNGITVVLVSHNLSEIYSFCDKVIVMERGKISREGSPAQIFSKDNIAKRFEITGKISAIEPYENQWKVLIHLGYSMISIEVPGITGLKINDDVILSLDELKPEIKKIG